MCIRFAEAVRRFGDDKILHAVPIQRHLSENQSISEEDLLKEIHLLCDDGTVLKGAEAIQKIVTLVPSLDSMRWMLESKLGQRSFGFFYGIANRFRRVCKKCRRNR